MIRKIKILQVLSIMFLFLIVFQLVACNNGDVFYYPPENYFKIEFDAYENVDVNKVSALVSIGLEEDSEQYEYKLFAYNKKDSNSIENWFILKDVGQYSSVYNYTINKKDVKYSYSESINIPSQIFYGDSGIVCFSLVGEVYINGESSFGTKQTIEYSFIIQNGFITLI